MAWSCMGERRQGGRVIGLDPVEARPVVSPVQHCAASVTWFHSLHVPSLTISRPFNHDYGGQQLYDTLTWLLSGFTL